MKSHPSSRAGKAILGAAALALLLLTLPAAADRGGHGGRGGRGGGGFHGGGGLRGGRATIVVGSPFYYSPWAWNWYYGFGWGYPGWGYPGWGYRPEGGLNPAVAGAQGLGAFDLKIKPKSAEVWVDGRFLGQARDFDGYPAYLWLKEGEHTLAISKGGYATWERQVTIDPGRVSELELDLARGPSEPLSSD